MDKVVTIMPFTLKPEIASTNWLVTYCGFYFINSSTNLTFVSIFQAINYPLSYSQCGETDDAILL